MCKSVLDIWHYDRRHQTQVILEPVKLDCIPHPCSLPFALTLEVMAISCLGTERGEGTGSPGHPTHLLASKLRASSSWAMGNFLTGMGVGSFDITLDLEVLNAWGKRSLFYYLSMTRKNIGSFSDFIQGVEKSRSKERFAVVVTERTKLLSAYTQLNTARFSNSGHEISTGALPMPLFVLVCFSLYLRIQLRTLFHPTSNTIIFWKLPWSSKCKPSLCPLSQHGTSPGLFLRHLYLLCVLSLFTYISVSLPNLHMPWGQTFQMHHFSSLMPSPLCGYA